MTLKEWNRLKQIPITDISPVDWKKATQIPIEDNGEPLVPVSLSPERVLTRPQYFLQGLPGAISDCYVRCQVWQRLRQTAEQLPDGYKLVVLDGYRPERLQIFLFDRLLNEFRNAFPDKEQAELEQMTTRYVARPGNGLKSPTPHSTGGAVDLMIVDARGNFLDMGSGFDENSPCAATGYFESLLSGGDRLSSREIESAQNRRAFYHIMTRAGFCNYPEEWWHFDFGDQVWACSTPDPGSARAIYGRAVMPGPPSIL